MHRIRIPLCLKAVRRPLSIHSAIFALCALFNKVCRIKLHPRLIRTDRHSDTCFRRICPANLTNLTGIFIQHIIVIVSTGPLQLRILLFYLISDLMLCQEIHRCPFYRNNITIRVYLFIDFCKKLRLDLHFLILNISPIVSVQIKIGMVCHVDQRRFIRNCKITDMQRILLIQRICHDHLQRSREALIFMRTVQGKGNRTFVLPHLIAPHSLMIAMKSTMQTLFTVVGIQCIGLAVQCKAGSGNAVTYTAKRSAKGITVSLIVCCIVIPQHHIRHLSIPIRHEQRYDSCPVVSHGQTHTLLIFNRDQTDLCSVLQCSKFLYHLLKASFSSIFIPIIKQHHFNHRSIA